MLPILRFVHVIGLAVYFSAVLGAGSVLRLAHGRGEEGKPLDAAAHQLFRLGNAGLVFLLVSGVAGLMQLGIAETMKRPSVHIMLAGWVIGGALTGIASSRCKKLSLGTLAPTARAGISRLALVQLVIALGTVAAGVWRF